MLKVGITGGIGSGKTYICQIFQRLGIKIYTADERARYLMNNNLALINEITKLFGPEAYEDKVLNKAYISNIVFRDKLKLEKLNASVHPAVESDFIEWCSANLNQPYILHEAAILFESGFYKKMDKNIFVNAPEELRIKRVIKRDSVDHIQVMNRIHNQMSAEKIIPLADFIIENNDKELILPQIIKIDQILKEL